MKGIPMKKHLMLLACMFSLCRLFGQGLSREEQKIVQEIRKNHAANVQLLQDLVNINSGSLNVAGVRAVGDRLAAEYRKIGFTTEWITLPDSLKRAGHLVAYRKGTRGKRLLLIGHLDTVFEPDMQPNPWRILNDSTATGQGVLDMKGGDVMMLAVCQALSNLGLINDATIVCYYTGDEESTGDPEWVSRQDFISRAQASDVAIGFETALGLNTVSVGRRGSSSWKLTVQGRQGHSAGVFSSGGYGAIYEAARILDAFRRELKGEQYLTFSPGVLAGGTELHTNDQQFSATVSGKTNIIAPQAVAYGDLRFLGERQKEMAREKMRAIAAQSLPGTSAEMIFYDGFPSMEPKPGNYELVKTISQISTDLGYGPVAAGDPGSRGAGDISWIARYVDAVDGLGASGSGAHAPGETIHLGQFPKLAERAALLVYRLTRPTTTAVSGKNRK